MQIPIGQVPEGSGADAEVRFRGLGEVLEGYLGEIREGSGADAEVRFRRVEVRFRKAPVQRLGEVPEGSGADPR